MKRIRFALVVILSLLSVTALLVACGGGNTSSMNSAMADGPSFVQFNMHDGPLQSAQSVNINIQQIDLSVSRNSNGGMLTLPYMGFVDILKLQNGVLQTLGNLVLPSNVTIHQMRLILGTGNNVVLSDGTVCNMETPSAAQSGVKLLFVPALTTQPNTFYDITLDFDLPHSVIMQGNGTCLLKPVIKVDVVTKTPVTPMPSPTPMPVPSASAMPSASPGASASPMPSASASPTTSATPPVLDATPTPSPTASPILMFQPVGSPQTVDVSGSSDGSFSATSDPQDPPTIAPSNLWSM